MMSARAFVARYWPGLLLLIGSLLLAACIYSDYGMSWDEPAQRGLGKVTYAYVMKGDNLLKSYDDRGLGSGFELPLYYMEQWLHLKESRDIFLMRHIVTHLFFLLAVFCGYLLALRLFKSQLWACFAFIFLAFHPRIYAHSFFNSKDIPFLSAFLISMLLSHIAFEKNNIKWFILAGVACGYTTSIRAMGILLLLVISAFMLIDIIHNVVQKKKTHAANIIAFVSGFCIMLYVSWPMLWSNPFFCFIDSFHNLAKIVWKGTVLFEGSTYAGDKLPWNYLPVWFIITVPELLLICGFAGSLWLIVTYIKKPSLLIISSSERNLILYLGYFLIPALAMIIFHGVNIDDWRHIYFIYPPFVILALYMMNKIGTGKRKYIVAAIGTLQVIVTGSFMITNHPFEQVYFNHFISHRKEYLRNNFDTDYWGLAYKQGIDYILNHDTSSSIRIYAPYGPVMNNTMMLPESLKHRIVFAGDNDKFDYFITNFRMHPADYNYPVIYYEIKVLNSTIMRVYKLH